MALESVAKADSDPRLKVPCLNSKGLRRAMALSVKAPIALCGRIFGGRRKSHLRVCEIIIEGRVKKCPAIVVALVSLLAVLIMTAISSAVGDEVTSQAKYFITFIPSQLLGGPTEEQIERAKRAKESRPAAQDPEGHWGDVVEGFQLSMRFAKESFRVGEPIAATVIIRNAAGRNVYYRDFIGMREDSPVCQFDVLDEQQQPVPRRDPKAPDDITDGPHVQRGLSPGTQCRYEVKMEARFQLDRAGKYSIRARRWVHKLNGDGYSQLQSSLASITILKTASGSNGPNARAAVASPSTH